MKRILYLSFHFEPDLSAGSIRNSSLAKELSMQLGNYGTIDLITTVPKLYSTFGAAAQTKEKKGNINIERILIRQRNSGILDEVDSFKTYFNGVKKLVKKRKYDLVFASSSRLFTAHLGYLIAKKQGIPLYLDIRDIFTDTMRDALQHRWLKAGAKSVLEIIERRIFNYASHINLISAGFKPYFERYNKPFYSAFSHGIDPKFLNLKASVPSKKPYKLITYAGNLGEGQALHIIIPQAAKRLGPDYRFLIIGDGGAKQKLVDELELSKVDNVEIRKPVPHKELLLIYEEADFLFLHLNDYTAFKMALPSKIFELGAYDKPVIAGVAGYASQFIEDHIPNKILFLPGDVNGMVEQLEAYTYQTSFREAFLGEFKGVVTNKAMSESILSYLPKLAVA